MPRGFVYSNRSCDTSEYVGVWVDGMSIRKSVFALLNEGIFDPPEYTAVMIDRIFDTRYRKNRVDWQAKIHDHAID